MERVTRLAAEPLTLAILVSIALLFIGNTISPGFASGTQIVGLLTLAAILGIVAAGQNLVIIAGREGIDLSVGGMISLGAILAGNLMNGQDGGIAVGLLAACGVTFLIGIVNGLGVTLVRIPPLVMTLGMAAVLQGALVVISSGIPSGRAAPALAAFIREPLFLGIPGILLVWVAIAIGMWLLLRRSAFGYALYATGANERAAILTGIATGRVRILVYGLSGFFSGLTGACLLGYTGNTFISVGDDRVLPSIIAVVIGGTSLAGGAGGYFGTMAGAVVLVLLESILTTLNIADWGRQVIFGVVLLGLMLLYGRQARLRA